MVEKLGNFKIIFFCDSNELFSYLISSSKQINFNFSISVQQLPKFFYLCEDGVWGVRKACADVFMPVSCVCSPSVRKAELSPIFINLLKDQSRWVRMTAYQALGPFISTFADSNITALLHNDNGEIGMFPRAQFI